MLASDFLYDRDSSYPQLSKKFDWFTVIGTRSEIQILPEFQNRGIGCRLIENIQLQACDQGLPVVLSVLKGNPAKRLYEKLGFRVALEKERSYEMRYTASPASGGSNLTRPAQLT
ncbi:MAG: GNAT family N-acetyltransferase [Proteobacteria bacterium]|nr:GNAT family N-acetyltransferase [Pseudomonadota bacterium]